MIWSQASSPPLPWTSTSVGSALVSGLWGHWLGCECLLVKVFSFFFTGNFFPSFFFNDYYVIITWNLIFFPLQNRFERAIAVSQCITISFSLCSSMSLFIIIIVIRYAGILLSCQGSSRLGLWMRAFEFGQTRFQIPIALGKLHSALNFRILTFKRG